MLSNGNGSPQTCVYNLMKLFQGEVPYDRLRGMNPDMIDKNTPDLNAEAISHAVWLIETYEPRVTLSEANIITDEATGSEIINLNTIIKEP